MSIQKCTIRCDADLKYSFFCLRNSNYGNKNMRYNCIDQSLLLTVMYKHVRGRRGRDRMVVGVTTTCTITTKVVSSNPLDSTLCNTVCQ